MNEKNYSVNELIEELSSKKASEPEFVSIKTYADMYNISPLLLLEDIIEGKYQSAICLISECDLLDKQRRRMQIIVFRKEQTEGNGVQIS